MSKFKVGEIVILNSKIDCPEKNGMELTILNCFGEHAAHCDGSFDITYEVDIDIMGSGNNYWHESSLKKLPLKDTPAEFDESIFMPEGLKVS